MAEKNDCKIHQHSSNNSNNIRITVRWRVWRKRRIERRVRGKEVEKLVLKFFIRGCFNVTLIVLISVSILNSNRLRIYGKLSHLCHCSFLRFLSEQRSFVAYHESDSFKSMLDTRLF